MPIERVSKGFLDLSMTFQVNPINFDAISLKNESAIARSIRNLVLTNTGERFFNQSLGSDINSLLFETYDSFLGDVIKDKIENVIKIYEPRVNLISVNLTFDEQNKELNAIINYRIVGIDALPQQLSFALQPTR